MLVMHATEREMHVPSFVEKTVTHSSQQLMFEDFAFKVFANPVQKFSPTIKLL